MPQAIGLVPGIFDLFHVGDLDLLTQARDRCTRVVAAAASDDLALAVWGRSPFIPEGQRLEILTHLRLVDHAVQLDRLEVSTVLADHDGDRPTHLFVGGHLMAPDRPAQVDRLLADAAAMGLQVVELTGLRTSASPTLRHALGVPQQRRRSLA